MNILTRQFTLSIALLFPFLLSAQIDSYQDVKTADDFNKWREQVNIIRSESLDSAIYLYQASSDYFLEQRDTLNAVNSLVEMATLHGHEAKYQHTYDNLWKALLYADLAKNDEAKVIVYIQLGRYYSFYNRKEKALEYLQRSTRLSHELVNKGDLKKEDLYRCYYALCSTYRDFQDSKKAQVYLDSCYQLTDKNNIAQHYLQFETALIKKAEGNYQEALNLMLEIRPWMEEHNPSFLVLLYTHIGDAYLYLKNIQKEEQYYRKALSISEQYNSHLDFTPIIYERLSKLYAQKGDYKKAFASSQKEKILDAEFFDSRSQNNWSLLEIKDEFRVEKEKQNQLIQQQRLEQLENEERVNFLENMILSIAIIFLIFASILYFNYIRKKHKVEKDLIRKKRELEVKQTEELRAIEVKQANELLELKNKELATSSLKLIEKDEILSTLKEKLSQEKGDIKAPELKKIVRSISSSNAQNWDEFEARFMSVNKVFYKKLNENYPKLSRGDQKICALVKLNFSSKEMAKLLGISIESVHTNRYRLRRKLNLSRDVSLTEFVAKL